MIKIKYLLTFFIIIIFSINANAQIIHNNRIDSILNLVSVQSISKFDRELSGDTLVTIGGIPQILFSRFYQSIGNVRAAQYLYEKFQSFGLTPKYMFNNATNVNVYAVKTGTKYPNKKYIIGAHYDDIISSIPGPSDTIHGADDNASGICAVLEAARLLASINLDYTVVFIGFDEEEMGLFGSKGFADSSFFRGDSILGVINLDMIGWDSNNDNQIMVMTNTNSESLYSDFYGCNQSYQVGLDIIRDLNGSGSDHESFWARGYKAITPIERTGDFNIYYHSLGDTFDKFNITFFHKNVKAAIATLATWALGYRAELTHTPIVSGSDTSAKVATVNIHFPVSIATGNYAPRLYYKLGTGQFNYLNAFNINGETYKFLIPGAPAGSKISYYFAVQDSSGSYIVTLPSGGGGINPPGTIPPTNLFIYYVWTPVSFCSNSNKPINDNQILQDTIHISQTGTVADIKVNININHSNDGDILIMLVTPNSSSTLSQFIGNGGQNYINTIFDDTASMSIDQSSPPYTGRFRPHSPLTGFVNTPINGNWILKIYDNKPGNQGTLLNWCLQFKYASTIGIQEISKTVESYKLFQNYPNPFNPTTNIRFRIPGNKFVTLKVYDMLGKEISTLLNENLDEGEYEIPFNADEQAMKLSSGVYFYRLTANEFVSVKRMLLIK